MILNLTDKGADGKPQIRQDAIDAIRAKLNCDAGEAVFFARELLRVKAEIFEQRFPELIATSFMSRASELTPTDEHWTYQNATMVGKAEVRTAYSSTAPRADVYFEEATPTRILPIVSAYGYTFQEARASAATGKRLEARKAMAARRAIAQEVDEVLSIGKTLNGVALKGLINQTGTATYSTPTGSGGSKAWTSKTPDEVYRDMVDACTQVSTDSSQVERVTDLLLPSSRYEYVRDTRMGIATDTTILQYFQRNRPDVRVRSWWRLETVSGVSGSGKRMIGYNPSPEHVQYALPVEFEQMAPQMSGFETLINCHARIGGVKLYLPKSMIYGDEI